MKSTAPTKNAAIVASRAAAWWTFSKARRRCLPTHLCSSCVRSSLNSTNSAWSPPSSSTIRTLFGSRGLDRLGLVCPWFCVPSWVCEYVCGPRVLYLFWSLVPTFDCSIGKVENVVAKVVSFSVECSPLRCRTIRVVEFLLLQCNIEVVHGML